MSTIDSLFYVESSTADILGLKYLKVAGVQLVDKLTVGHIVCSCPNCVAHLGKIQWIVRSQAFGKMKSPR